MRSAPRAVLDTNVVLSALLFPRGQLSWLRAAWQQGRLRPLVSKVTTEELMRAIYRDGLVGPAPAFPAQMEEHIAQYLRDNMSKLRACDGLRIDRCYYDPRGVLRIDGLADHAAHAAARTEDAGAVHAAGDHELEGAVGHVQEIGRAHV